MMDYQVRTVVRAHTLVCGVEESRSFVAFVDVRGVSSQAIVFSTDNGANCNAPERDRRNVVMGPVVQWGERGRGEHEPMHIARAQSLQRAYDEIIAPQLKPGTRL